MGQMLDPRRLQQADPPPEGASAIGTPATPPAASACSAGDALRLMRYLAQTGIGLAECDGQGGLKHINAAAVRLLGLPGHEAVVGQPLQALAPAPGAADAWAACWREALAGRPATGDFEHQPEPGRKVYARWQFTPLREATEDAAADVAGAAEVADAAGVAGVTGVLCVVSDITADRLAQAEMAETRQRLLTAQRMAGLGALHTNLVTGEVTMYDETSLLLDCPPGASVPRDKLIEYIDPEDLPRVVNLMAQARARRAPQVDFRCRCVTRAGRAMHIRVIIDYTYGPDGTPLHSLSTIQDVSTDTLAMQALAESEARLDDAQSLAHVGDWEWDFVARRGKLSKEAARMLRRPLDWNPGWREFVESLPLASRQQVLDDYTAAAARRAPLVRYDYALPATEAEPARDIHVIARLAYQADGRLASIKAVMQDITELKAYQRQLHELAFFDPLTRLPNRALFRDRIGQALTDAAWHTQRLGLLMLGLDRFKQINDTLGHGAGDELLRQTAARLRELLRDYDTVARLAGDEFAIVLPEVRHATDLAVIAGKVVHCLAQPFAIGDQEVVVTASLGAALYPDDAQTVDDLLKFADAALHHAKARGRNTMQFYSRELTEQASERLALENDLRRAIERDELLLYYQPKIDLANGRIVGAEALMRWRHPQRGLVPPDRFIGIAEDTGLIVPMGTWALESACRAATVWNEARAADAPPLKIAVNLSPRQFGAPGFVETVCSTLNKTGCRPAWVELEITESLLLDAHHEVRAMLQELVDVGLSIAIDDFGTGYSALSYLTRFPVQTLKIDRSFVRGLPGDHASAALVKAVTSLARSLQLALVAEGVETDAQAKHLSALGCQMAQGFLYARPLPQAEFEALLRGELSSTPA